EEKSATKCEAVFAFRDFLELPIPLRFAPIQFQQASAGISCLSSSFARFAFHQSQTGQPQILGGIEWIDRTLDVVRKEDHALSATGKLSRHPDAEACLNVRTEEDEISIDDG